MSTQAKQQNKVKGVYEREPGSSVWWIRFADIGGHIRREKVGNKGAAIKLYQKRKTEVLQGKKLPEQLRAKPVTFGELADDALAWSKVNKITWRHDQTRLKIMRRTFEYRAAESITPQEFELLFTSEGMSSHRDQTRKGSHGSPQLSIAIKLSRLSFTG